MMSDDDEKKHDLQMLSGYPFGDLLDVICDPSALTRLGLDKNLISSNRQVLVGSLRERVLDLLFGKDVRSLAMVRYPIGARLAKCHLIWNQTVVAFDTVVAGDHALRVLQGDRELNVYKKRFASSLPHLTAFVARTDPDTKILDLRFTEQINGSSLLQIQTTTVGKLQLPSRCPLITTKSAMFDLTRQVMGELYPSVLHTSALNFFQLSHDNLKSFLERRAFPPVLLRTGVSAEIESASFTFPTLPRDHEYQQDQGLPVGNQKLKAERQFIYFSDKLKPSLWRANEKYCMWSCDAFQCGACRKMQTIKKGVVVSGAILNVVVLLNVGEITKHIKLRFVVPAVDSNDSFNVNGKILPSSRNMTAGDIKRASAQGESTAGGVVNPGSRALRMSFSSLFANANFLLSKIAPISPPDGISNKSGMIFRDSDRSLMREFNTAIIKAYRLKMLEAKPEVGLADSDEEGIDINVEAGDNEGESDADDIAEEELAIDPALSTADVLIEHIIQEIAYSLVTLSTNQSKRHTTDLTVMQDVDGNLRVTLQGKLDIHRWADQVVKAIRTIMMRLHMKYPSNAERKSSHWRTLISKLSTLWNMSEPVFKDNPLMDSSNKAKRAKRFNEFSSTFKASQNLSDDEYDALLKQAEHEHRMDIISADNSSAIVTLVTSERGRDLMRYLTFVVVSAWNTNRQQYATTTASTDYWKVGLLWTMRWKPQLSVVEALVKTAQLPFVDVLGTNTFDLFTDMINRLESMAGEPVSDMTRATVEASVVNSIGDANLVSVTGDDAGAYGAALETLSFIGRALLGKSAVAGTALRVPDFPGIIAGFLRHSVDLRQLAVQVSLAMDRGRLQARHAEPGFVEERKSNKRKTKKVITTIGGAIKAFQQKTTSTWQSLLVSALSLHEIHQVSGKKTPFSLVRGTASLNLYFAAFVGTLYTMLPRSDTLPVLCNNTGKTSAIDASPRRGIQSGEDPWMLSCVIAAVLDSVSDKKIADSMVLGEVDEWIEDGTVVDQPLGLAHSRTLDWKSVIATGWRVSRSEPGDDRADIDDWVAEFVSIDSPFANSMRNAEKWLAREAAIGRSRTNPDIEEMYYMLVLNTVPICAIPAAHALWLDSMGSVGYTELCGRTEKKQSAVEEGEAFKPEFLTRLGFLTHNVHVRHAERIINVSCNSSRLMQAVVPNHPGVDVDGMFVHPSINVCLSDELVASAETEPAPGFYVYSMMEPILSRMHTCSGSTCECHVGIASNMMTKRKLMTKARRMQLAMAMHIPLDDEGDFLFGVKMPYLKFVDSTAFHVKERPVISIATWERMSVESRSTLGVAYCRLSCFIRGVGDDTLMRDRTNKYDFDSAVPPSRVFVGAHSAKNSIDGAGSGLSISSSGLNEDDKYVDLPDERKIQTFHCIASLYRFGIASTSVPVISTLLEQRGRKATSGKFSLRRARMAAASADTGAKSVFHITGRLPRGKTATRALIPHSNVVTFEDSHGYSGPHSLFMGSDSYPRSISVLVDPSRIQASKQGDAMGEWKRWNQSLDSQLVIDPLAMRDGRRMYFLQPGAVLTSTTAIVARVGSMYLRRVIPSAYNYGMVVVHVSRAYLKTNGIITYWFALVSNAASFTTIQQRSSRLYQATGGALSGAHEKWRPVTTRSAIISTPTQTFNVGAVFNPSTGEEVGSPRRVVGNARPSPQGVKVSTWVTHIVDSCTHGRKGVKCMTFVNSLTFRVYIEAIVLFYAGTSKHIPHTTGDGKAVTVSRVRSAAPGSWTLTLGDGKTRVEVGLHSNCSDWRIVGFVSQTSLDQSWSNARGSPNMRPMNKHEFRPPVKIDELFFAIEHADVIGSTVRDKMRVAHLIPEVHNAKGVGVLGGIKTVQSTVQRYSTKLKLAKTGIVSTRPVQTLLSGSKFFNQRYIVYNDNDMKKRGAFGNGLKYSMRAAIGTAGQPDTYTLGLRTSHYVSWAKLAYSMFANAKTTRIGPSGTAGLYEPSTMTQVEGATNYRGLLSICNTSFPPQRGWVTIAVCSNCKLIGSIYYECGTPRCANEGCRGVLPDDVRIPANLLVLLNFNESVKVDYGFEGGDGVAPRKDTIVKRGDSLGNQSGLVSKELIAMLSPGSSEMSFDF